MQYPSGVRKQRNQQRMQKNKSYSNRGMTLEDDINETNKYYLAMNRAIIHKKPTPVQIVRVHYPKRSAAVITEAYFQAKSTTDYNGIYRGKHIDFEAKETKNKSIFPLTNIHDHQFQHMQQISEHGGITFVIIRFTELDQTFLLEADILLSYWEQMLRGGRKSIPLETFQKDGHLIPFHYQARVDYLTIIDELYF
ncbi:MAG TPA: Holliday junction resolvase RecU [Pseudogracilibacillus sp.]|nr:Holliday junction resolvase RecU [Pseudogracilibacillus sp.]